MRAIDDDSDKCHAVEKRPSRNVADETVGDEIDKAILEAGAKFAKDDTLILVDPTEIRKEFGLSARPRLPRLHGRRLPGFAGLSSTIHGTSSYG